MQHTAPTWLSLVFSTLIALPLPASAQGKTDVSGEDPLLGTWHLNVSKSKYRPGPPPRSQTRTYEKHRFGIQATVRTVYPDGRLTLVQSVWDYDSMEYRVTGSEELDAIRVRRISPHTHEATLSHGSQVIGTFRRVISEDRMTMTVFNVRRVPPSDNVEVYEKDER